MLVGSPSYDTAACFNRESQNNQRTTDETAQSQYCRTEVYICIVNTLLHGRKYTTTIIVAILRRHPAACMEATSTGTHYGCRRRQLMRILENTSRSRVQKPYATNVAFVGYTNESQLRTCKAAAKMRRYHTIKSAKVVLLPPVKLTRFLPASRTRSN
jgi:hypothetical protein